MRILTKQGESRWLSDTSIEIVDENGQAAGAIGSFQDITSRKQTQVEHEKLITELEKRNAELERFTYTVSHELKSPVITIKGYLGSIMMDIEGKNYERAQIDLGRISSAADKMLATLSDLLELSRIGHIINPPKEIDTTQLVEKVFNDISMQPRSHNVTFNVHPNLPVLYGDHIRLREVFENLVDNAVKYMGSQEEPAIEIGFRNESGEHVFYVKDNGIGIEGKYHGKIFGLFEKLDPNIEGTGIGLALVKRIIETHGGRIWAESEGLGKGSTFCFTIPDKRK